MIVLGWGFVSSTAASISAPSVEAGWAWNSPRLCAGALSASVCHYEPISKAGSSVTNETPLSVPLASAFAVIGSTARFERVSSNSTSSETVAPLEAELVVLGAVLPAGIRSAFSSRASEPVGNS